MNKKTPLTVKSIPLVKPRNWVAKHAKLFCKPKVEENKKKSYKRTPKHKNSFGGFTMALSNEF